MRGGYLLIFLILVTACRNDATTRILEYCSAAKHQLTQEKSAGNGLLRIQIFNDDATVAYELKQGQLEGSSLKKRRGELQDYLRLYLIQTPKTAGISAVHPHTAAFSCPLRIWTDGIEIPVTICHNEGRNPLNGSYHTVVTLPEPGPNAKSLDIEIQHTFDTGKSLFSVDLINFRNIPKLHPDYEI